MAREKKTERQRAEEALAVAVRKHDRIRKALAVHRAELKALESDMADAEQILAYRRQHPALPATPATPPKESTTS